MNDGGKAFPESQSISIGSYIHLRKELYSILQKYNLRNYKGIGSTGKAPVMHDIDIVAESDLSRDQLYDLMKVDMEVKKSGSSMIHFLFHDIQVDLVVTKDRKFVDWSRCGPSYLNGRGILKGAFKNLLLNALLRVISSKMFSGTDELRTRYVLDFDSGMYLVTQTKKGVKGPLKDWKTIEKKLISEDPDEIVKFIFDEPDLQARYTRSMWELVPIIKKAKRTSSIQNEIFKGFMDDIHSLDKSMKMFGKEPDLVIEVLYDLINDTEECKYIHKLRVKK